MWGDDCVKESTHAPLVLKEREHTRRRKETLRIRKEEAGHSKLRVTPNEPPSLRIKNPAHQTERDRGERMIIARGGEEYRVPARKRVI